MHIITDGWQAYNQLAQHYVVHHQLHFVDPNDPTLHTNMIEGLIYFEAFFLKALIPFPQFFFQLSFTLSYKYQVISI